MRPSEHPRVAELDRRLRAGEQPAIVAVAFPELTAQQVRARKHSITKRKGQGHTAAVSGGTSLHIEGTDEEFVAQLDLAKARLDAAVERGLPVASIKVGHKEYQTWWRDHPDEAAISVPGETRQSELVLRPSDTTSDVAPFEIRQAHPLEVHYHGPKRRPLDRGSRTKWALIVPDGQRPFIDHRVVDLQFQVLTDLQAEHGVHRIVHLGDDLDLPEFSKHRSAPDAMGRIQEAIDGQHQEHATERVIAPDALIDLIEGNHEARLINWLTDNAPKLIGIRRAGEKVEPVMSVPFLLRLDELGVTYHDPYPEGELWLNAHLRCIHGDIVKGQKGATAAAYLAQGQVSTIYGHIHRSELVYQTRHTKQGPRSYFAGSPGCRCRLDGVVPSAKTGVNRHGKSGRLRTEDWQHGLWVVGYETTGRQLYHVEPVTIWGGVAHWRGRTYEARVDIDGKPVS